MLPLRSLNSVNSIVGCCYIAFGVVGAVSNVITFLMICTNRVYRLSAYTLMANMALADTATVLIGERFGLFKLM
ncbi:unnamed protein product [Nippostrongylus brasiliensis]|uniref:G_PROTEIN_RECEP_F1_2 domain-containing protein n=1 Tax=Nippostrongylus brasiliensis TaxID=27835 RepID=A0A0N4YEK8_NIPBR|nr:hypothetical protein Q1695_000025 [Nippostrongylus brasiliensis]VDL78735.1 unnamed protein product [Nippostrongylus brasiliensis]